MSFQIHSKPIPLWFKELFIFLILDAFSFHNVRISCSTTIESSENWIYSDVGDTFWDKRVTNIYKMSPLPVHFFKLLETIIDRLNRCSQKHQSNLHFLPKNHNYLLKIRIRNFSKVTPHRFYRLVLVRFKLYSYRI